jgi:histidine triad (HIT) family protein
MEESSIDCIFCEIIAGQASAEIVYEDAEVLAFLDIHPLNPGHTLVVPKRHARNLFDIDPALAGRVMERAAKLARAIRQALNADGLVLSQANEPAAAQTVFHFHIHLIPRWDDDGLFHARWRPQAGQAHLQETAARIRESLEGA